MIIQATSPRCLWTEAVPKSNLLSMLKFLLRTLEAFDALRLLDDPESRVSVFRFAWTAITTRVEVPVVDIVGQPSTVVAVQELEADHVTIFHRDTILRVFGEELKSGERILEPVVSLHGAVQPVKNNNQNIRSQFDRDAKANSQNKQCSSNVWQSVLRIYISRLKLKQIGLLCENCSLSLRLFGLQMILTMLRSTWCWRMQCTWVGSGDRKLWSWATLCHRCRWAVRSLCPWQWS